MINLDEWNSRELAYCAALVRTGGDSPRVPASSVDSYLETQIAGARRDKLSDVEQALTLLQVVRALQATNAPDHMLKAVWIAFWKVVTPTPAA